MPGTIVEKSQTLALTLALTLVLVLVLAPVGMTIQKKVPRHGQGGGFHARDPHLRKHYRSGSFDATRWITVRALLLMLMLALELALFLMLMLALELALFLMLALELALFLMLELTLALVLIQAQPTVVDDVERPPHGDPGQG